MARQIQLRRGTTVEHANFIGAPGEVTVDTDLYTLHVHDGETPGGTVLAKQSDVPPAGADYVVASQQPTSANGYTWYRKYKSGWVEQGGYATTGKNSDNSPKLVIVTLPIEMSDSHYHVSLGSAWGWETTTDLFSVTYGNRTTTSFKIRGVYGNEVVTGGWTIPVCWSVAGVTL